MDGSSQHVFITGGTGYMGSRLIPRLLARGCKVTALVRPQSQGRLPSGCFAVTGDALDATTYQDRVSPATTFVQLVGVSHPSPAKAAEFRSIDLVAGREAVAAAVSAGIRHFIYVSVARPAPMMKAYLAVRAECEVSIRESGLHATILRPWYVLDPGHRWPYALVPAYWVLERLPSTREGARRLGLVTLEQMLQALTGAVEDPSRGVRVWGGTGDSRTPRWRGRSNAPHPLKTCSGGPFGTKVTPNYQSSCPWDICSLNVRDEMLRCRHTGLSMDKNEYLEDVHLRILRVTEDLRAIQRELNCAAMEAPGNPELMEALSADPELESLGVLKSALDQMRHFLWFYGQVVTNESEFGDRLRETIRQKPSNDGVQQPAPGPLNDRIRGAAEALMLQYLADRKTRKPN
ncbi:MAG: NAD(P)H-binding protein [Terriglobales bacterium]